MPQPEGATSLTDIAQLAGELKRSLSGKNTAVVTVDGATGAGKSHLALSLARHLAAAYVEVDQYVIRAQGTYVRALRVNELGAAVHAGLSDKRVVVLDAICMEDVLSQIGVTPDRRVYVVRVSAFGHWHEAELFDPSRTAEQVIRDESAIARAAAALDPDGGSGELPELRREIIEYHYRQRPERLADFIFARVD